MEHQQRIPVDSIPMKQEKRVINNKNIRAADSFYSSLYTVIVPMISW